MTKKIFTYLGLLLVAVGLAVFFIKLHSDSKINATKLESAAVVATNSNPSITSPIPGEAVGSLVHFVASGSSSHPIIAWAVYDDSAHNYALLGKWNGTSLDQNIAMSAGVRNGVVVQFWDSSQTVRKTSVSFTVNPYKVIVSVSSPTVCASSCSVNYASSMQIVASASSDSNNKITGWHIYVDGVDKYGATNVSNINTNLTLSKSAHTVNVRAWDSKGVYGTTMLAVSASASSVPVAGMPNTPPTTVPSIPPITPNTPNTPGTIPTTQSATTVTAETSNNTSAADNFGSLSCKNHITGATAPCTSTGNETATNVSKIDIHSLLYAGNTTQIFAHYMPWFGNKSHINIGINENDPAVVANQINDMVSRGINGSIVDWYGPGNFNDKSTINLMKAAETHPGFHFMLTVDKGAITSSCDLACNLKYAAGTYYISPAYYRVNGRPVIGNFGIDSSFTSSIMGAAPGNPIFFFQSSGGFSHAGSGGAFAWYPTTNPSGSSSALNNFYATAEKYPSLLTIGSVYKGFNDILALWTGNRVNTQNCGQTWLQTFADANSHWSAANQLDALQLVTWNDYEEGSEMESGINNCVSISGSLSGANLNWSITGQQNTVHNFTVFISTDGVNLSVLQDNIDPSIRSLNLSGYKISSGSYKLFVKAVGQPSMTNHMTDAISYSK